MAKVVTEYWACDRCGVTDDRWRKPGDAHTVTVSVDYGTAGGTILNWRELCVGCNRDVAREIDAMKATAQAAKQALLKDHPHAD